MDSRNLIVASLLVAACALAGGPAAAETYVSPCHANWWEALSVTDTLEGLPTLPTVPLPAAWSHFSGADTPPDPNGAAAGLDVVIRGPDGAAVAGVLGVGFALPINPPYTVPFVHYPLDRWLWWRPLAPLAPGTYTASLTVADPGADPSFGQCPWHGFEGAQAFVVVAAPTRTPGLTTSAAFHWHYEDVRYIASCDGLGDDVSACPNTAAACCRWSYPAALELETLVTATGLNDADAYLYALLIERDAIRASTLDAREVLYPVWTDLPMVATDRIHPHAADGPYSPAVPFPEGSYCVLARLYSLAAGKVVATAQSCANTSGLDRTPAPPVCDPEACAAAVDPGTEPVADASVAEPVADTAGGGADTTDTDPLPSQPQQGGCGASGGDGTGAVVLLALLAAAALVLRRTRGA